jgi:phosphoribosyl-dephospho-CoA transferase
MRRHALVYLRRTAWRRLRETHADLASNSLVTRWIDHDWPLIVRRPQPDDGPGLALGLPLPPSSGKRRLSVVVAMCDIAAVLPPPSLKSARYAAPPSWLPTLNGLLHLGSAHGTTPRLFGSLAWQSLTGLEYITAGSDLDLLLPVRGNTRIVALTAGLAALEATAPMRLDGELLRDDGAAVNWRELHAGTRELLVKSASGVAMIERDTFVPQAMP